MKKGEIVKNIREDCGNLDLPKDWEKAFDKIKCPLNHGSRIYWYYKEDIVHLNEADEDPRDYASYSGLCVCLDGNEIRYIDEELETDECVVIIDMYPTEKCYPECSWKALNRLLDDEDLVEIFRKEKGNK